MTAFEKDAITKALFNFGYNGFIDGMEIGYFKDDMLYLGQIVFPDDSYHEVTRVEEILVYRELLQLTINYMAANGLAPNATAIHPHFRKED